MTYDELLQIIATSEDEDWITADEEEGIHVYRGDLNVSLELLTNVAAESEKERAERMISSDWAVGAGGEFGNAYHREFRLYYGGTPVQRIAMAEIAGTGVFIPFPLDYHEGGYPALSKWKYRLGRVATRNEVAGKDEYDRRIEQANILIGGADEEG